MAKQTKYKITVDVPILIIGLVSTDSDLKMSWSISKALHIQLSRVENVAHLSTPGSGFACYRADDDATGVNVVLLSNKSEGMFFFSEYKNLDFFLFIKGNVENEKPENWLKEIRKIKEIPICTHIPLHQIKKPERLDFI